MKYDPLFKTEVVKDLIILTIPLINGARSLLLRSDAHRDHPCSRAELELEHLKRAKADRCPIIDGGDMFDAMQGRHDPRRSHSDLDPRDRPGDDNHKPEPTGIFDRIVMRTDRDLAAYAQNFAILMRGNHETAVAKNADHDLTGNLAERMVHRGSRVVCGGYQQYILLRFTSGNAKWDRLLFITHGAGGNAPVTRGMITANRRAVWLRDPDIVMSGHTHDGWTAPIIRETIDRATGQRGRHAQWHVQVPSYKDVLLSRQMGYEAEKEFSPKPIGAWFLHAKTCRRRGLAIHFESDFEM